MNVLLISLGCDKNLVDSEFMLGSILDKGYEIVYDESIADVIVINTCCFINDAKEESINTILEMAQYKEDGNCKALIVCGCLAQRYSEEIKTEIPEVDAIVGTTAYEDIIDAIEQAVSSNEKINNTEISDNNIDAVNNTEKDRIVKLKSIDYLPAQSERRVYSTGTEYSYLKIAEGCDKHCTYCIIPKLRGSYRSVPIEDLIKQAEYLAGCGVKELILVAQETTLYGTDLYVYNRLPELLDMLCQIEGIEWIRLLYAYPEDVTKELAECINRNEKICSYIDIPIQHSSDRILKLMGRRTTRAELVDKINMLRTVVPDIAIRTTLITGFPGETEEDHNDLVSFIKEMRFDRLGVFTYSEEEGTAAASMSDQIPEDIKLKRYDELMNVQQDIAFEKAESMIGEVVEVIVEGEIPEDSVYVGRTRMDAPNIDGCVFFPVTYERHISGDIIRVRITEAVGYDLLAVPEM